MARIRTIKPEFWQDEKLAPCDPMTRLVFLGLISMADDCGRLLDNLKVIDAFIFPETDHSAHEPLMRLSRMARIRRGRTASGQRIIQIANWDAHQKVQHPNVKGSLPEIVEPQEVTAAHEPLMNDSGAPHEPLTPHTNDLRPTTYDQRPSCPAPADAGTGGAPLALVPPDAAPRRSAAKPAKTAKPAKLPKWPDWPPEARDAAWTHWRSHFGGIEYARFVAAAGPTLGEGLPNYDRPAVWHAWRQCVEIASVAGSETRFLRDPARIGGHLAEACRIIATTPNPVEQLRKLQVLLHGRELVA